MPSTPIPIPLSSRKALASKASDERQINCYAEQTGDFPAVYAAAGLTTFSSAGSSTCRGIITVGTTVYALFGTELYSINSAGVGTLLGNVPGTGYAKMRRNAALVPQIAIVTGGNAYLLSAGAVALWPDLDLPQGNIVDVEWIDGYFYFGIGDGDFYWSDINNSTVDPLHFGSAEAFPDGLIAIVRSAQELYFFGTETIEVYANSGDANAPFQRLSGAVVVAGCASMATVQEVNGSLYFLDTDDRVKRIASGYETEIVSDRGVYDAIRAVSDKTTIEAFTYVLGEHDLYVLTCPGVFTWEFDAGNGKWHERTSKGLTAWIVRQTTKAFGKNLVGYTNNGGLGYIDETSYSELGDEIIVTARFPRIRSAPDGGTFDLLDLEFQTGVGINTGGAGADTIDPQITLRWSDDGGKTWKGGRNAPLGKSGVYTTRVRFTRLGSCKDAGRIFQVSSSSKVFRALISASVTGSDLVFS
jgi:hypothetical protein